MIKKNNKVLIQTVNSYFPFPQVHLTGNPYETAYLFASVSISSVLSRSHYRFREGVSLSTFESLLIPHWSHSTVQTSNYAFERRFNWECNGWKTERMLTYSWEDMKAPFFLGIATEILIHSPFCLCLIQSKRVLVWRKFYSFCE